VNILFVGDVVGRPGRRAVRALLPSLVDKYAIDFTLANGENAAGGMGITVAVARELLEAGVQVVTLGNHVWKHKEGAQAVEHETRLIRPANYPPGVPGRGEGIFASGKGAKVAVLNLCGRTFMEAIDCPFRAAAEAVERLRGQARVLVVDMHAEATSEKQAMGHFLDGKASAIIGTHTHVQTADERVLPKGTAYITDVGMTGPRDSIIGMEPEGIMVRFVSRLPAKFDVARGPVALSAVVIAVNEDTGLAENIFRVQEQVEPSLIAEDAAGE
jgi:hypothetical protein